MIHYFLDLNKNYRDFKRRSVYHRCVKHCAGAEIFDIDQIPIDVNHPWFGPPDACRNSQRDCANNQICNFFPEGFLGLPDHHGKYDNYDESLNWGLKMVQEHWNPAAWKVNWYSIGENLCIMYRSCLKIDTMQSNFTTQHVTCPEGTIFQSSCSK